MRGLQVAVAGPARWQDLTCRYLNSAGVAAEPQGDDSAGGSIRISPLHHEGPPLQVLVQDDAAQTMRELGLALSQYLITLAMGGEV